MKYLLSLLFLGTSLITSAQNITTVDLDNQDIQSVITNLFDIEMQKYDLSAYLDNRYNVVIYIDEYTYQPQTDSLAYERISIFMMGENRKFIDSADYREQLQGEANFNNESGELTLIESLTIAAKIESDSTALLSLSFRPSKTGGSLPLKVIPLEQSYMNRPQYNTRPFKFNSSTNIGDEIPLLLYGSYYYDEEAKLMRFCGANEIDPNLSTKIVENIPHFYVVGIIFKEVDAKQ